MRKIRRLKPFALNIFISIPLAFALLISGPTPGALAQSLKDQATQGSIGIDDGISFEEFKSLAAELAPKVNLFNDLWSWDPKAQVFGGTVRDYLYWLKRQLVSARSKTEVQQKINLLRSQKLIDVRDFIIGDSDVDIISRKSISIRSEDYGVKKIDYISDDRFDTRTESGRSEVQQGFIPVEKIRLGRAGFVDDPTFGAGVSEIYSGRPTLTMPPREIFETTEYAKKKLNHPILLVLRYLRTLSINYYSSYGLGAPNKKILFDIDKKSREIVEKVASDLQSHDDLVTYQDPKFLYFLKTTHKKTFRSHTNPTAAYELVKKFGLVDILTLYTGEPVNQYVFSRYRDPEAIDQNIRNLGFESESLYTPASQIFPDLKLRHGTRTDENFRLILRQGILPSGNGSAGEGLYGVSTSNTALAVEFSENDANRLIEFDVSPGAKIVDITHGQGQRAFERFASLNNLWTSKDRWSAFAEHVGADILVYPYNSPAVVVKNADVLGHPRGLYRQILSFSTLLERVNAIATTDDAVNFLLSLMESNISATEGNAIFSAMRSKIEIPGFDRFKTSLEKHMNLKMRNYYIKSLYGLYLGLNNMNSQDPALRKRWSSLAQLAFEDLLELLATRSRLSNGTINSFRLKRDFTATKKFLLSAFNQEAFSNLAQVVEESVNENKFMDAMANMDHQVLKRRYKGQRTMFYLMTGVFTTMGTGLLYFHDSRLLGVLLLGATLRAVIKDFMSHNIAYGKRKTIQKADLRKELQTMIKRKKEGAPNFRCAGILSF